MPVGGVRMEASNEFLAVLNMSGCLVSDCICGRTHFATNSEGLFDDGELERLRKMAIKHPDLYVEYPDCDSVHVASVLGIVYAVDCPCEKLAKVERYLWAVKDTVLQYYRLRIDKEKAEKVETEGLLAGLEGRL